MTRITEEARPVVAELKERSDEELYQELALRVRGIVDNPQGAGDVDLAVTDDPALLGPLDDLQDFGRRFFERLMPDAYKLMCGAEDEEERKKIGDAFSLSVARRWGP